MKAFKHFKLVMTHKYYVFRACAKAGIPFRGLMHDMSKFHPIEFCESVKYFTGVSSPINEAKKDKGYSDAWFHHRGVNKHHWAHWVDDLSSGGKGVIMPYKYALEMACDFIGAGQAYMKDEWSFDTPYDWFRANREERAKMHPAIVQFISTLFRNIKKDRDYRTLDKKITKALYDRCVESWKAQCID